MFNAGIIDGPMKHIDIQIIGSQTPQAAFQMSADVPAECGTDLGGDHRFMPDFVKRLSQGTFAGSVIVHLCGVKKIDAEIQGLTDYCFHIPLGLGAPVVAASVSPAAHAQHAGIYIRFAKYMVFHIYINHPFKIFRQV